MKSGSNKGLGLGLIALLPICCVGLPLLAAASIGVAALAWGGAVVGALVAVVALAVVLRRATTRRRPVATSNNSRIEQSAPSDRRAPEASVSDQARASNGPLVEILYFDGCPNHHPAIALVQRVSKELGVEPEIRLVNVPDAETAEKTRFLGSPTIRVAGRDVDPRTEERSDYQLSCRVFQTDAGLVGQPDEQWGRDAGLPA